MKYQCGCGKEYSSYPAYSTHKRIKHENIQLPGTSIPKQYNPKRGRPSFSIPHKQKLTINQSFAATTIIEVGLLKLQEKYGKILSQPQEIGNIDGLNYTDISELTNHQNVRRIVEVTKQFNQTIVTHTQDRVGSVVSDFMQKLCIFLANNLSQNFYEENDNIGSDLDMLVDMRLINKFFRQKGHLEYTEKLCKSISKQAGFLLDMTAIYSQYLHKLGLANSVLKLKD